MAERLIREYSTGVDRLTVIDTQGNIELRRRLPDLNQIAMYAGDVLVLTDLDRPQGCPAELVREWTRRIPDRAPNLLIRVAVLEIEAWVMADRAEFANWLGIPLAIVPRNPEGEDDAKRTLIELARRSPKRNLRDRLIHSLRNGLYTPATDYNILLSDFVEISWRPEYARRTVPSLDRAIARISNIPSAH